MISKIRTVWYTTILITVIEWSNLVHLLNIDQAQTIGDKLDEKIYSMVPQ